MEPIVTLPYSEWMVAEHLATALPARHGYSVFVPLSRQEKGVDLLVTHRASGRSRTAAVQVKFSRTYEGKAGADHAFGTFFNRFRVPEEADFFVFATLYPNITGSGRSAKEDRWLPLLLLFTRTETTQLLESLRTKSGGKENRFYFGFSSPKKVVLTRGSAGQPDYTKFLFANRVVVLKQFLSTG